MYETYYQLKTKPFTLLPDPDFLYLGAKHKLALSLLEYGLANGSAFIVITGNPGTGKTTLLNRVLDQSSHPWVIGVLSNMHGGLGGLMPWIAASFGLPTNGKSEVDIFHDFARFLEREHGFGRRVLLILDEAQNAVVEVLEELRLLSNLNDGRRRSLQILLSGQLGLQDLLKRPGMVQFAQRIGVEYVLEGLSEDETVAYIDHRLDVAGRSSPLFSTLAGRVAFRLTDGIPRLINQLCDHALVYGYAEQAERITAQVLLAAATARAKHGVIPLVMSPEDVQLSEHELDSERQGVTGNTSTATEHPMEKQAIHPVEGQSSEPGMAQAQDPSLAHREGLAYTVMSPENVDLSEHEPDSERIGDTINTPTVIERSMDKQAAQSVQVQHSEPSQCEDLSSLYQEGLALKKSGEYRRAIGLFDRLAAQESWSVKALAQKGLCFQAIGKHDQALTTLLDASSRRASTKEEGMNVQYLLGRTLESRERYDEAREIYEALDREQQDYRDVPDRLARLHPSDEYVDHESVGSGTRLAAFWRGCGQFLRGRHG
ncbi:MAG: AAA family ATPase [Nitrospira sp.]